jgi:hypothetical protein
MDTDPIVFQIDQIIQQRIDEPWRQYINITTIGHAAASLLLDLGPEQPDELADRRRAREYLEQIIDADT